jgi:hypothetical protein
MKTYDVSHHSQPRGRQGNGIPVPDTETAIPRSSLFRDIRHRIELIGMVMTALAALLAGWSIYQASQWFGLSTMKYGFANIQLTTAVQAHMEADRQMVSDLLQFQDWLHADRIGDLDAAGAVESRFSDRFRRLFQNWRDIQAKQRFSSSAGDGRERLVLGPPEEAGDLLAQQAKEAFQAAQQANVHGNDFLVAGILFGLALLFGFCCIRMDTPMLQDFLLAVLRTGDPGRRRHAAFGARPFRPVTARSDSSPTPDQSLGKRCSKRRGGPGGRCLPRQGRKPGIRLGRAA